MGFDRVGARLAALAGIAAVALTCGSGAALAAGELRIANSGEPDTLDPHHVEGVWENRIIGDMFLGLTTEAADGSVIPGAAESWEVSDDGTVYTFALREHNWSDGTPVSADDFVFALQRILDPAEAAEYASLLYTIKNAQALNEGAIEGMDQLGVRALDPKTLEITLEGPTPYFIEQLTHYTAFPVPEHKVEELGDDWIKPGNLVGNGAYTVVEWLPNTHVKSQKNEAFYDAANVAIDTVYFFPAEERNAATKRFRAGEIDVQYDFASEQIDWLEENLPEETRIAPWLGIYYYAINTRQAPFDKPALRQALAMAIDREAITDKVLRTGEIPAYSFVPPGTGNYGEPAYVSWKGMPYDERLAKAKQLMAEAGFGPDNPLELTLRYNTSENHKKIAIAVAAMWKALGVQTELFNAEVKVHYNDIQEGNFQVARAGWIADYNDAQNFLYLMDSATGVLNYAGYASEEFDRLMREASATADLEQRAGLLHKAEAVAMEDMPNIPINYYVSKNLVAKHVKGWVDNTKDIHRTRWLAVER
ncbi:MAG TPA: peptide ABC transporter substrate-binding protein [Geminicoccaceae bacterium]|nr:peptide ABC transporter substrate-binding protein [Geminicoccaceae bacterium]